VAVYLFRIAEKIIEQCQADMPIDVNFVSQLLEVVQENPQAMKLWETIKARHTPYLNQQDMQGTHLSFKNCYLEYLFWINQKIMTQLEAN
jgi:hypothetical protein